MGSRNNKPARIVKGTAKQPTLKDASGIWSLDEAMQAHRANAWPQPNLFQPVANSLRIKYQIAGTYPTYQNGYLYRHPGRTGNQYAWTWSAWIKYSQGGYAACILGATTGSAASGDYRTQFIIDKSGSVSFGYAQIQIATYINFVWPLYLRDPSAWYHIVLVFDSLNSTTANRLRLYVNGVQQTATTTTCPQGQVSSINGGVGVSGSSRQSVGMSNDYYGNSAYWYDGLMSEVNFVDGYTLQPTQFGQYDNNNAWVPIPYTGSYGTNGYYLPFTNATTSQTLGYDASLTGTTTYDADQDPYRGSVALHLTGNGPAGGNNNVFADSSTNNLAITRNGSVTQGSFSPFPLNTNIPYNPAVHGGSAYFGTTTSDNIYAASNSALTIGTNNFTLEFWANWTAWSGEQRLILMGQSGSSAIEIGRGTASNILQVYTNTSLKISYSWSPTIGAWNHIAVVRSGTGAGQLTLYINGVNVATGTSADSISTNNFFVGGLNWATGYNMQGYISNVRLINGASVYTAAFTPPNRPFGTLTNNLITFSENLAGAWWANNTSNTEGTAIAPDGTPSATTLATGTYPATAGVGSSTVAVTGSIYAKANVGNQLTFRLNRYGSGADYVEVIFNLTTGTATGATTAGTASGLATSIVNVGNGWWRCVISGTTSTTGGTISFNPNPTSGSIFIWGAQLETGGTATNYTPTPANFSTAPALLLNFANAAVVDSAGANNITTLGTATITSASKYGSGALTFNGTSDYFQSSWSLSSFLSPGSNNWTLETWVYMTKSLSSVQVIANYGYESGTTRSFVWYYNGDGTFRLAQSPDGSTNYDAGFGAPQGGFALNTWYHLAIVRNSGAMTMYVNGKSMPNTLSAYTISSISTGVFRIGVDSSNYFGGSMDDVRLTKGVARYTTDFAPPARALPEVGGKSFVTTNINAGVVRSFTTTGTTAWTAPTDVTQVEVLVVAAGGTGASDGATNVGNGGGGGGGVIYNSAYPVTPGQTYTVTVGAGQVGLFANSKRSGGNSQFGNLIAIGGGGGGYYINNTGADGGSGGGGGSTSAGGGAGTGGQGFNGGTASSNAGGGGGGAGGIATGTNSRDGGPGLQFGISGTPTYYAGGGGGSASSGAQGTGGIGGGGAAGTVGTNGTANTGGGGGAQINGGAKSGDGGSGVVVVRYTTTAVGNTSDSTSDNLVDSPTLYGHDTGTGGEVVGNYATWNPLDTATSYLKNGNLSNTAGGANKSVRGTIAVSSGKWYWEFTIDQTSPTNHHGIWSISETTTTYYVGQTAGSWGIYDSNGNKRNNGSFDAYGSAYTLNDIGMVALDMDNGKIWWGKNGTWFNSGAPAAGANAAFTNVTGTVAPATLQYSAASYNFGQRAWAYAPPQGFNALTTKNLPRLVIGSAAAAPNQYFDVALYSGNSSTQTISTLNFQPDLIWIKSRSNAYSHWIGDSVRGFNVRLYSDGAAAEASNPNGGVTAVSSTGFTVSAGAETNNTSNNYVAWCWRAGGAPVSNTSGTITSQVSANTASGFSIVTWTGSANGVGTMGHGLGTAPKLIITKQRNQTGAWYTYTTAIDGTNKFLLLNTTATAGSTGVALPTSTVFSNDSWTATYNMIAYCWAEIAGFSKIGTWSNNNANDGTFVYTGFKPAMILLKNTDNAEHWYIVDSKRPGYNVAAGSVLGLSPNLASAEPSGFTSTATIDFVSNGFKIRTSNPASGEISFGTRNYIYMVFAEAPFGNVNGVAR